MVHTKSGTATKTQPFHILRHSDTLNYPLKFTATAVRVTVWLPISVNTANHKRFLPPPPFHILNVYGFLTGHPNNNQKKKQKNDLSFRGILQTVVATWMFFKCSSLMTYYFEGSRKAHIPIEWYRSTLTTLWCEIAPLSVWKGQLARSDTRQERKNMSPPLLLWIPFLN